MYQASNDHGLTWVCLREHVNDTSLNGAGKSFTWPISHPAAAVGYQLFRIRMTGPNSNNVSMMRVTYTMLCSHVVMMRVPSSCVQHLYLACSGVEFYGTLSKKPPASVPALPPAGKSAFALSSCV